MPWPEDRPRPRPRGTVVASEPEPEKRVHPVKHKHTITDRYEALLDGRLTIDDLDEEEIILGKLKNKNGNFSGAPPRLIPRSLHVALQELWAEKVERQIIAELPSLVTSMIEVAKGNSKTKVGALDAQVKATIFLVERAIGKTVDRQKIETTITAKWEEAATAGRLFVDIETTDVEAPPAIEATPVPLEVDIVEAEIVEERPKTGIVL
jgi:predicted transcriptional regulator